MARVQQKASDLRGLFIYQDKKRGTVYYDIFTKNGYILTASDTTKYTMSAIFIPAAIIIFYILIQFNISTLIAAIISIVLYITMLVIYRFKFLYKLPCIENYQREKRNSIIQTLANGCSIGRLYILLGLAIVLIVACIVYTILMKVKGAKLIGMIALTLISCFLFYITLKAYQYKKTTTK